jgi:hypothetical protein
MPLRLLCVSLCVLILGPTPVSPLTAALLPPPLRLPRLHGVEAWDPWLMRPLHAATGEDIRVGWPLR